MNKNHYVAIMAGGVGSRFWPVSRTSFPKQFLDILNNGKTFLQSTYDRFAKFIPNENIYIVTSDEYISLVKDQLPGILDTNILGEPQRKNTAPCIAYVSHKIHSMNPEGNLIVAPSDHLIKDEATFAKNCIEALSFTEKNDAFVTFGIKPSYANTGYGYIETAQTQFSGVLKVNRFTEKPDLDTAQKLITLPQYFWNSGIFVWKTKDIINSFEKYASNINSLFAEISSAYGTEKEVLAIKNVYEKTISISIDYAILEKADNVFMIPAEFDWSDLGTWNSAWENFEKDEHQNAVVGNNNAVIDSHHCIVHSNEQKLIMVGGVDNLIIVNTPDALMICHKDKEQSIKTYLNSLKGKISEVYF